MNFMWFFPSPPAPPDLHICRLHLRNPGNADDNNKTEALKLKLIVVVSILVAGPFGVCVPLLGMMFESFRPESNIFFVVKFFATSVILATGFGHVFVDANKSLENPCLGDKASGDFPLGNFVEMLAAVVVMMVETAATNWFNRSHYNKNGASHIRDEEKHEGHMHVHTHTSDGHAHVHMEDSGSSKGFLRHRIISQIHTIATMSIFFTLTTPIGIALGFGISNKYDENNHKALIVQGVLNAASAGILIYMALVDLLAVDFMKVKVRTSTKC
ncbi:hypothetical protein L2E82_11514 [Cichorium intybus]|uniref:Uncharacterized protein n=1 Tax=Cichorium intybus TaxID=13427 RepID=A0ACB9GE77_CICIN|nr:hypothetical protein L2E82_11514 [Cichorium intybus]